MKTFVVEFLPHLNMSSSWSPASKEIKADSFHVANDVVEFRAAQGSSIVSGITVAVIPLTTIQIVYEKSSVSEHKAVAA